MIWLGIISWGSGRGLVAGAVVGVILGTLLYPIIGTIAGLFIGGIIGAFLGVLDGIALAIITHYAYAPADRSSHYPRLVYSVPILINISPIVILCFIGAFRPPHTWDHTITVFLAGCIPITLMGIITHYFAGLFLEFTDQLMLQKASRNPPANMLSLGEN